LSKFYRINSAITAPKVRLISEKGESLGVVDTSEARSKAQDAGTDLVEIAAGANPPVVKLINYKKYRYQEAKKDRLAKRGTHKVEMKELWLGPLIGQHDLETRVNRGREFLESGDHVKFTVKFSGAEMSHKELGYKVLDRVKELLNELGEVEKAPQFLGRQLFVTFKPKQKG
jgi:translation initiation factor IF-3